MSGLLGSENKKAKRDEEKDLPRLEEGIRRPEGPSPFSVDLIKKIIFSHLEDGDLLMARLVAKDWTPLATEEVRGRKTTCLWIYGHWKVVDERSAVRFMDVMTPSIPFIPLQQVGLRLDLLSIQPSTLLRLLGFIAPWVKALHLVPWGSDVDVGSPLERADVRIAMAWSSALHSFPPLHFPRLETLHLGEEGLARPLHQSDAMSFVNLMTKVVQGARSLQRLSYFALFFGSGYWLEEMVDAEREATKGILSALPPSLKSLAFGPNCSVDYGALTTLHLNLEEFLWEGEPESSQEFMEFLEGQKTGLKRLQLLDLEDIYDSHFPFVTDLGMTPEVRSSFKRLKAFPALLTLRVPTGFCERIAPSDISDLPTHQGVRKLVIPHLNFTSGYRLPFTLFAHVLPNLTQLDIPCMGTRDLTPLFTHFSRLTSLKLTVDFTGGDLEGLQSILTGLHPSVLEMAKDIDILDAEGFAAIEVIGSRRGNSTVGLGNLKDLQVLDISGSSKEYYEFFLSKLTFGTAFMKMRSLKEILIGGELPKACDPVLEALRIKGISVRVCKVKE